MQSVVAELAKRYQIPILIERFGLASAGITSDMQISSEGKDTRFGDFLQLMLRELNLVYEVQNEMVLITTKDEREKKAVVRVYPVGDFLPTSDNDLSRQFMLEMSDLIERNSGRPTPGWETDGGVGSIGSVPIARALVVYTTMPVHAELEALLAKLRQARSSRPVSLPAVPDFATKRYKLPRQSTTNGGTLAPPPAKTPPRIPPSFDQFIRQFVNEAVGTKDTVPDVNRGDVITLEDAVIVRNSPAVHRKLQRRLRELQLLDEGLPSFHDPWPSTIGGNGIMPVSPTPSPQPR